MFIKVPETTFKFRKWLFVTGDIASPT